MPMLIEESFTFGLLTTISWPVAWLAFSGLAALAWFWRRRRTGDSNGRVNPSRWWLALLTICPLTMLVLAEVYWEQALPGSRAYAIVYLLHALLAIQVLTSYFLLWIRMKHQFLTIATCALGLMWGFGTYMVSGFSVTGSWP